MLIFCYRLGFFMRKKFAHLHIFCFNILVINILKISSANLGAPAKPCG